MSMQNSTILALLTCILLLNVSNAIKSFNKGMRKLPFHTKDFSTFLAQ